MSGVKIAQFFGVIVRKESLDSKSLEVASVKRSIETSVFDEDDKLLSFGPCFGEEAVTRLCEKLEVFGLEYVDDYFVFQGEFPEWASFSVQIANKSDQT